jgi:hypothetical protein
VNLISVPFVDAMGLKLNVVPLDQPHTLKAFKGMKATVASKVSVYWHGQYSQKERRDEFYLVDDDNSFDLLLGLPTISEMGVFKLDHTVHAHRHTKYGNPPRQARVRANADSFRL